MKLSLSLLVIVLLGFSGKAHAVLPVTMTIYGPHYSADCKIYYTYNIDSKGEPVSSVVLNFGDGVITTYPGDGGTFLLASHTYLAADTYTVDAAVTIGGATYNLSETIIVIPNTNFGGAGFIASGVYPAYSFTFVGASFFGDTYTLNFGDGTSSTGTTLTTGQLMATHNYAQPGTYNVKLTHTYAPREGGLCTWVYEYPLTVGNASEDACCSNFSPEPGKEYWLSGWVQEEVGTPVLSYSNKAYIELEFVGSGTVYKRFYPSEDIIEGWQRIIGEFIVPAGTTEIKIHMINENTSLNAYFDDIRIHPFNGSMKSYVYDPVTLLLTAELDDNNYATFYEYDKEGQLIRIKKETSRGIMTIQESKSGNPKKAL